MSKLEPEDSVTDPAELLIMRLVAEKFFYSKKFKAKQQVALQEFTVTPRNKNDQEHRQHGANGRDQRSQTPPRAEPVSWGPRCPGACFR